jgi:hypothetical protein
MAVLSAGLPSTRLPEVRHSSHTQPTMFSTTRMMM